MRVFDTLQSRVSYSFLVADAHLAHTSLPPVFFSEMIGYCTEADWTAGNELFRRGNLTR